MAKIPVKLDSRSVAPTEVTAIFYVNGKEYVQIVQKVPEYAVAHVIAAAFAQIDDPDTDGALESARASGEPLPKGF